MSILVNAQNVDARYAPILEPNLFYESVFVPDVTYTDQYQEGAAGEILVHKLKTTPVEPGTPGRDFTDEKARADLITIAINNNFQKSKKIYGVQAAEVGISLGNENLSLAIKECSEGRQLAGVACLIREGNAAVAVRAEIIKAKGVADVVLCSPGYYALILKLSGSDYTPDANDQTAATGRVGQWLGMNFIECPMLAEESGQYYDYTGALRTVDFTGVDYIVYNHRALSIIDSVEAARLIDSEYFAGTLAQVEMNTGYRVTNPALVRVRKHKA